MDTDGATAFADAAVDARLQALADFLQNQSFCFLGTASADGDCDCSYRGRKSPPQDLPEPLLAVLPQARLWLPDYPGNNFFNTLGNLRQRPELALLFVDFSQGRSVLLQGRAELLDANDAHRTRWPTASRVLDVCVVRVQEQTVAGLPPLQRA